MASDTKPRSFFLNEQHELTREEREGGGGTPKYAPIDWVKKSKRLQTTLARTRERIQSLPDPTTGHHYYLLAKPEEKLKKISSDKKKAPSGEVEEVTSYSGKDSRVFGRLGMDLLGVAGNGAAIVHTTPERIEQLETTSAVLQESGLREQARWATIESFSEIPLDLRVDKEWLDSLQKLKPQVCRRVATTTHNG